MSDLDLGAIASDMEAAQSKRPITEQVKEAIKAGGDSLAVHPSAEVFPLMAEEDADGFNKLVEDIANQGEVLESIKIDKDGTILDGRNRIRAITELASQGVNITFNVEVLDTPRVQEWITSTNLHRRHLTDGQRAYVAAELAATGDVQLKEAAKQLGVSERSAKRANSVRKNADEKTKQEVKSGKKKVSTAVRETTGKRQGSQTKQEIIDEAKDKGALPPKAEAPPKKSPATKKATKKKAGKLSDEDYQLVRDKLKHASVMQLQEVRSLTRGLLTVAQSKE